MASSQPDSARSKTARPAAAIVGHEADAGVHHSTLVDLTQLIKTPENYDFFSFRPHVKKLILSGTAAAKHISILWYTEPNGRVGRHFHAMTEAVYAIAGTQTDDQGVYATGSLYFNPPGSSHAISDSTGFFLLAYASPPDFENATSIEDFTPVHINTAELHWEARYPFTTRQPGVRTYDIPLDLAGGLSAQLIQSTTPESYAYNGNYLLVLEGRCSINGMRLDPQMLVVAHTVATQSYHISAVAGHACLVFGLSF